MDPNNNDIPEMQTDRKYSDKKLPIPEDTDKIKKEMEKTKKELEKIKGFIVKKYPFTQSVSVLPPQAMKRFIEEEEVPKETEKYIQLYVIVPEEKFKQIPKIKGEIVKEIETLKQKIWLNVKTPVDVWETCLDSKFDLASAIAMSFPLYDKGFLGALRVAEIHKSLVLQKFERYVVSYVIGGSLVRGEAVKTSDVDVFVIINDTDVKRMPRLELKERLRSIIYQYIAEAAALAGVKNKLEPQIYLLTDFWESVKDAHPVIFTFIRDGIPIYDRGTFMPWKALLKMGKLKPSPEAIDMFMKTAEKTKEASERRLVDAMIDVYYGVLTPSQALIMLYGLPPPTHKESTKLMEDIFVKKEKMLNKSDLAILERAVKEFKAYEHDPKYKISGKEIDDLVKGADKYFKTLKELRTQIEKKAQEKTIEQIYKDVFELMKTIVGKKSQEKTVNEFKIKFVNTGKFTPQHLRILNDVIAARKEFKKGKSNSHKIDEARKNASILVNDLIEYSQRCDLVALERGRMTVKYGKGKIAELLHCDGMSFLIEGTNVKKLSDKVYASNIDEVSKEVAKQKSKKNVEINPKVFELLKKEVGKYEITL
ncbi:MAG: nucleotidyltransferase domain-containing protein [archaeon]